MVLGVDGAYYYNWPDLNKGGYGLTTEEKFQRKYEDLLRHRGIVRIEDTHPYQLMANVPDNDFDVLVLEKGEKKTLGVTNMSNNVVLCARGTTRDNKIALGVFSMTKHCSVEDAFQTLVDPLLNHYGCSSIETFAISGLSLRQKEGIDLAEEVIRIGVKSYHLKGVCLKPISAKEVLDVYLCEDTIFYRQGKELKEI